MQSHGVGMTKCIVLSQSSQKLQISDKDPYGIHRDDAELCHVVDTINRGAIDDWDIIVSETELFQILQSCPAITTVTDLMVWDCHNVLLEQILDETLRRLTGLTQLTIKNCSDLKRVNITGLTSLQTLKFSELNNLIAVPETIGELTGLTKLTIRNCEKIQTLPDSIAQLGSLKTLHVYGLPEECSYECLFKLTNLTTLSIGHLNCTWINHIQDFQKLQSLDIKMDCTESHIFRLAMKYKKWPQQLTELKGVQLKHMFQLETRNRGYYRGYYILQELGLPTHAINWDNTQILQFFRDAKKMEQERALAFVSAFHARLGVGSPAGRISELQLHTILGIISPGTYSIPMTVPRLSDAKKLIVKDCTRGWQQLLSPTVFEDCTRCSDCTKFQDCTLCSTSMQTLEKSTSMQTLELCGLQSPTELPETINRLTYLTDIFFQCCNRLIKLPNNIGGLKSLQTLNLDRLPSLIALPSTIGGLTSLQTLSLDCLESLTELPSTIGGLKSLKMLFIWNLEIRRIPPTLGALSALEVLSIKYCYRSQNLFDCGICDLLNLHTLEINNCPLRGFLPGEIAQLVSLKTLILKNLSIKELPGSIAQLSLLETLVLKNLPIKELPDSIAQLVSLKTLYLKFLPITKIEFDFGGLSALQSLEIVMCEDLREMPDSIARLGSLEILEIYGNFEDGNVEDVLKLTNLTNLTTLSIGSLNYAWINHIQEFEKLQFFSCHHANNDDTFRLAMKYKKWPQQLTELRGARISQVLLCDDRLQKLGLPEAARNWTNTQILQFFRDAKKTEQERALAFVMAFHNRLGVGSPAGRLSELPLHTIFDIISPEIYGSLITGRLSPDSYSYAP